YLQVFTILFAFQLQSFVKILHFLRKRISKGNEEFGKKKFKVSGFNTLNGNLQKGSYFDVRIKQAAYGLIFFLRVVLDNFLEPFSAWFQSESSHFPHGTPW
ncbi:hypothetical protein ACJX0J_007535, partial [Zea mays]